MRKMEWLEMRYEQALKDYDELQKENKQLKEQIQDALGIANERINYYFHINNEEVLKDWEEIFDTLRGDNNE